TSARRAPRERREMGTGMSPLRWRAGSPARAIAFLAFALAWRAAVTVFARRVRALDVLSEPLRSRSSRARSISMRRVGAVGAMADDEVLHVSGFLVLNGRGAFRGHLRCEA